MQIEFDINHFNLLLVKKAFTMHNLEQPFIFIEQTPKVCPIMISVPHCGRFYPPALIDNSNLNEKEIRGAEDFFVDELSKAAPNFEIDFIYANVARAYIDLNRCSKSLDGLLIDGVKNNQADALVRAGQGIIPRILPGNLSIFRQKISLSDALHRIENIYNPYHNQILKNLSQIYDVFGKYLIIDMHSMPNSALGFDTADIIIGDCFSKSCSKNISDITNVYFRNSGLKVRLNRPYAGGFTTQTYGAPIKGKNAIQIEINRSLYMNEKTLEKTEEFENIKKLITNFFKTIKSEF